MLSLFSSKRKRRVPKLRESRQQPGMYRFNCNHYSPLECTTDIHGHLHQWKLTPDDVLDKPGCPQCMSRMSIRCWKCGKPIMPEDYTTLYVAPDAADRAAIPAHTIFWYTSSRPVGCSRCAENSLDASGVWTTPGIVDPHRCSIQEMKDEGIIECH